jgi:hypothetical protein
MVAMYERLRTEVLGGQARPDGLGAVVYHGLIEGMTLLGSSPAPRTDPAPYVSVPPIVPRDRELLRLLTNMVLQTQSEVMHVY